MLPKSVPTRNGHVAKVNLVASSVLSSIDGVAHYRLALSNRRRHQDAFLSVGGLGKTTVFPILCRASAREDFAF
jgi:hypothetical protein